MDLRYMILNFYYTYFIKISILEWLLLGGTFLLIIMISKKMYIRKTVTEKFFWHCSVAHALLIVYYEFVLIVTVINRPDYGKRTVEYQLFWSLIQAYKEKSGLLFQEILINIIMFFPIGFLLALLAWFKEDVKIRYRNVICKGLLFSSVIEITQYVTNRGTSELGDIMYNCLGTVMGQFTVVAFLRLYRYIQRDPKN